MTETQNQLLIILFKTQWTKYLAVLKKISPSLQISLAYGIAIIGSFLRRQFY